MPKGLIVVALLAEIDKHVVAGVGGVQVAGDGLHTGREDDRKSAGSPGTHGHHRERAHKQQTQQEGTQDTQRTKKQHSTQGTTRAATKKGLTGH